MKPIPMLDLKLEYEYMKRDIDEAIAKCLRHQQWIKGPEVTELEERMAEYLGVEHCIGVASGTDALVISLRALAIKRKSKEFFDRDDEIITTPFTFVATGGAILRAGATPVFVDIDPRTLNIDAAKVAAYLDGNPSRAVGILPVHLYGNACDMDAIMGIAAERGLFVLEDAAQALGAAWDGERLGGIGDAGALSFFPSKNLGGFGDGGMVATNDGELAELARMLLQHGGKDKYRAVHIGYNSRLDTLQAAVLLAKAKYLEEMNGRRRSIASAYGERLRGSELLTLLETPAQAHHAYNQYTVMVEGGRRDELAEHLKARGISTSVYYRLPLHEMHAFAGRMKLGSAPRAAEAAAGQVLSLPIEPLMGSEQIERIAEGIKGFFGSP